MLVIPIVIVSDLSLYPRKTVSLFVLNSAQKCARGADKVLR